MTPTDDLERLLEHELDWPADMRAVAEFVRAREAKQLTAPIDGAAFKVVAQVDLTALQAERDAIHEERDALTITLNQQKAANQLLIEGNDALKRECDRLIEEANKCPHKAELTALRAALKLVRRDARDGSGEVRLSEDTLIALDAAEAVKP